MELVSATPQGQRHEMEAIMCTARVENKAGAGIGVARGGKEWTRKREEGKRAAAHAHSRSLPGLLTCCARSCRRSFCLSRISCKRLSMSQPLFSTTPKTWQLAGERPPNFAPKSQEHKVGPEPQAAGTFNPFLNRHFRRVRNWLAFTEVPPPPGRRHLTSQEGAQ